MWIEETEREKEREQYEEDRLNEQTEIRNVDWRLNAFASFSLWKKNWKKIERDINSIKKNAEIELLS